MMAWKQKLPFKHQQLPRQRIPASPYHPDQAELNSPHTAVQKDLGGNCRMTDSYLNLIIILKSSPKEEQKPHLHNPQDRYRPVS